MYLHVSVVYVCVCVYAYTHVCIYLWLFRYIIGTYVIHCHDTDSVIVPGYYVRKYVHNYYALKAYLEGLTIKNDIVL